jgi:ATP-dependent DNA helicase UvrD/PcrA
MKFIADLHVHSKYSRATAKNLDLENLYIAGQLKGITVLATGDVTHPAWFSEIKDKLVPAEDGLFKLKPDIARVCDQQIPDSCRGPVRFVLVSEISNIYKKNEKTRKNHNLVFFPDMDSAERFNQALDKIGNIKSDGRPILGLDARNLLEISLEMSSESFLVPAHIWTPWFSMLGSKSGFESVQECFEDLTPHIFAVETGLSSDPPMNWRVKDLDGLTLISNSDAHSPMKLGREANLFNTDLSYTHIKNAIKTGDPNQFLGTFEFFPEEGKYHIDGHRKCHHRSWPAKTLQKEGLCPVCGKPMTLGVLYRVAQLADRPLGSRPQLHHPFHHLIPLNEILSELLGVGPNTKTVNKVYHELLIKKGPELKILHDLPVSSLDHMDVPLLGEAIQRVRKKELQILPGYDGEFGTIKLFSPREKEKMSGQKRLFAVSIKVSDRRKGPKKNNKKVNKKHPAKEVSRTKTNKKAELNRQQRSVVHHPGGPIIIVAGPGTGKTFTLTHRIAYLVNERQIPVQQMLGLTFTNQAAKEMLARLQQLLPQKNALPLVTTFHSFCLKTLQDYYNNKEMIIIDDSERIEIIKDALALVQASGPKAPFSIAWLESAIIKTKQEKGAISDNFPHLTQVQQAWFQAVYTSYQTLLNIHCQLDYEDLIQDVVALFEKNDAARKAYKKKYPFVFVDEYQDINTGQYRILRALSNPVKDLCVIGDPDQSIYGFRGSDVRYFNRFLDDYPGAKQIHLVQNYRSTQTLLSVSQQMIAKAPDRETQDPVFSENKGSQQVGFIPCHSAKHEAVTIGKMIESMIGGLGFYSIDFGKTKESASQADRTFSDLAILYRTARQGDVIGDMLSSSGIPFQTTTRTTSGFGPGMLALVSFLKILFNRGSYTDLNRIIPYMDTCVGKKTVQSLKLWAYGNRYKLDEALKKLLKFPISNLRKDRQKHLVDLVKNVSALEKKISHQSILEKIDLILDHTMIREKEKNIENSFFDQLDGLRQMASPYGNNHRLFFERMALQADVDTYDADSEKVTLMTMHASKGLEFPVVFITGCEDGLIPFSRSEAEKQDQNEERRLFYVAMTRAKEVLYLTSADKRKIHGRLVSRTISPYVMDVENLLRQTNRHEDRKRPLKPQTQLGLFS